MSADAEKKSQRADSPPPAVHDAQEPVEEENEYLTGKRLWLVMIGAMLAIFLMALDQTIVANALPPISSAFNALDMISWIPTSFLLTQAPALPVFGQLNTLFSTKWLFMLSILWFELGSLLSGVATSIEFLIAARAIQGIGASGIFVCSMTMIAEIIPLKDRPKYFAGFGSLFVVASILGPILGGVFVDHVSWRWCFYINLPLAVPTIWFCLQFLPTKPSRIDKLEPPPPLAPGIRGVLQLLARTGRRLTRLDWIGALLSTGATTCLVIALQWGGVTKPWNSVEVLVPLVLVPVLVGVFIGWEYYMKEKALIPLSLFKNRTLVGSSLASAFTRMAMFIAIFELPLFFQAVKGHSPTHAGIDMLGITFALVFASGVFGFTISKVGKFKILMVIGPAFGIVGYGLVFLMDEHANWGLLIGIQILIGVSMGATLQNSMLAVQADIDKALIPQATGVVTYSQFLGGTIAIAVAGGIFASKLRSGLAEFAPDAPAEILRLNVDALFDLPPDQRAGAVHAYVKAIQWCMAPLGIVASFFTSVSSLIIRNVSVRKDVVKDEKKVASDESTVTGSQDLEAGERQSTSKAG